METAVVVVVVRNSHKVAVCHVSALGGKTSIPIESLTGTEVVHNLLARSLVVVVEDSLGEVALRTHRPRDSKTCLRLKEDDEDDGRVEEVKSQVVQQKLSEDQWSCSRPADLF